MVIRGKKKSKSQAIFVGSKNSDEEYGFWSKTALVQILVLSLTSRVTSGF